MAWQPQTCRSCYPWWLLESSCQRSLCSATRKSLEWITLITITIPLKMFWMMRLAQFCQCPVQNVKYYSRSEECCHCLCAMIVLPTSEKRFLPCNCPSERILPLTGHSNVHYKTIRSDHGCSNRKCCCTTEVK